MFARRINQLYLQSIWQWERETNAIIGAVTLDSEWDLDEIQSIVEYMFEPEVYLAKNKEDNHVELIQEWSLK